MIDLADMVVLGDRIRRRFFQPAAMDHADADMGLADVDVAHLLVQQLSASAFFLVFKFGGRV